MPYEKNIKNVVKNILTNIGKQQLRVGGICCLEHRRRKPVMCSVQRGSVTMQIYVTIVGFLNYIFLLYAMCKSVSDAAGTALLKSIICNE